MTHDEDPRQLNEPGDTASEEPASEPQPDATSSQKPRQLFRSRNERVIGGVCGGVAEYFQVDPLLVRIVWAICGLAGGLGVLAYLAAWALLPEREGEPESKDGSVDGPQSRRVGMIVGAVLILGGVHLLLEELGFRFYLPLRFDVYDFEVLGPLFLVGVGLYLLMSKRRTPRSPLDEAMPERESQPAGARPRRFVRSTTDRKLAGVCGGLAAYFNVDASLVRLGVIFAILVTHMVALLAYFVVAIVVPEDTTTESASESQSRHAS